MNRMRPNSTVLFSIRASLRLALVVVVCLSLNAAAETRFVHAHGKFIESPDGKAMQLRGISLGNWMVPEGYMFGFEGGPQSGREIEAFVNELIGPADGARFWKQYQDAYVTEEDIRFLHQAGFNSIRVPFHYKYFADDNPRGFELVDRVVQWAGKYGIYVVLDMHCAPGGQTGTNIDDSWGYPWLYESAESQEQTIRIWRRIAEHYHDNPVVLGYDLLNEPIPHYPQLQQYNSALEPIYKRITAAVREVDPNHVVILGGAQWDSNFKVFGPPFDQNVMYTFHKYWTAPTEEVIQPYLGSGTNTTCPSGWESRAKTPMNGCTASLAFWRRTRSAGRSGPTRSWSRSRAWWRGTSRSTGTKLSLIAKLRGQPGWRKSRSRSAPPSTTPGQPSRTYSSRSVSLAAGSIRAISKLWG